MAEKVKILVCGARFGQFYMEAIKKNEKYELAGILARGSDLAKACARRYETELYTDFEEASKNIDVVCIAVKTGVLGGNGTELAIRFLEKRNCSYFGAAGSLSGFDKVLSNSKKI